MTRYHDAHVTEEGDSVQIEFTPEPGHRGETLWVALELSTARKLATRLAQLTKPKLGALSTRRNQETGE